MSIFAEIEPIRYEGPDSKNELAFRWYDAERVVAGRTMREHMRVSVCFWHSFSWLGTDPFGMPTLPRPWGGGVIPLDAAIARLDAAFDFFSRLGVPYFAFHDCDVVPDASSLSALIDGMKRMEPAIAKCMERSGVGLLWGTANLFGHPRYAAGAATNPDPEIFRVAVAQVRCCIEATHRLGGENYVLWGGREGYDTLLNTDLRREMDHYGRFLALLVEHRHKIGFKGSILIEPKPHEPAKHQYDRDAATVMAFLQRYGLEKEVKLNIEANHATLAGNTFEHEVALAIAYGVFGSIDLNRGDPQNGWDTDQFADDVRELALVWTHILRDGGMKTGGFNFDAKLRRQSIDVADLYHAHIGGIDALARGLLLAEEILVDGRLDVRRETRYAGWDAALGRRILGGEASFAALADEAVTANADPQPVSGGQERCENLVNAVVYR